MKTSSIIVALLGIYLVAGGLIDKKAEHDISKIKIEHQLSTLQKTDR